MVPLLSVGIAVNIPKAIEGAAKFADRQTCVALSGRRKYRYHYHLTFGLLSTHEAIISLSNSRFYAAGVGNVFVAVLLISFKK
jgi:hypothetical protein